MATEWAPDADGLLWEPDFATYEDTFMVLWRLLIPGEGALWEQVATKSSGKMLKIHVSKSRTVTIYVRSAMNRQTVMRSEGLTTIGWVGIDEPARMLLGQKAFTNSLGRARAKMDGWNHNPIYMVGSPLGLGHWTADVMGCTTDHPRTGYYRTYCPDPLNKPDHVIRACRTSDNADNLADNYEEGYRMSVGDALASQEMNASLLHASGMVFPEWRTSTHVLPHDQIKEMWTEQVRKVQGGTDWGTHIQACEVTGWTKNRELLVIDEWYKSSKNMLQQGVAMDGFTKQYALNEQGGAPTMAWYCDPADGGTDARGIMKKGFEVDGIKYYVGAQKAKNAWEPGISLLRQRMSVRPGFDHPARPPGNGLGRPGMFVSDRCVGLIKEAPAYRLAPFEEGKPLKDGHASTDPLCDDHACDATRYAAFSTAVDLPTRSYGRRAQ